jgi:DNA primase
MSVPDAEIQRVRAATDIVALIGEHVALRKTGQRWTGLCPFHTEKTPSFSVNAEEGLYYCFGCQKKGDAITFVRETQHADFLDAVRQLAERAGIELHEDGADQGGWKDRAALFDAMERAVQWYHERLLHAPDAGRARDYLRSRGYDKDTVTQFRLGWAPDEWDGCTRALSLRAELATASGLGFVNKAGRLQDAMRARVLFPILDPGDRPIALGGRILPGREGPSASGRIEPKYKNTQETAIYQKRRTLYGLNWAKKDVVASNEVVVCEGYTDVIAFFRAGLPRAVATCGTALAEEHFRVLRNFATRVVLAYDADAAGQHAAESVYQWERSHEVAVAVARLPMGTDPGELGRNDPDALVASVRGAVPFLQFRLDASLANADLSSPEGRARAADRALAVILQHPSDLVRDQYVMQVAERCRLDPALVRADAARRLATGTTSVRPRTAPPRASAREDRPGTEALRLALHERKEVLGRMLPALFADPLQRRAFEAVAEAADNTEAIDAARARGDDEVVDLLCRLLVEEPQRPPTGDPATPVIAQLIRHATRRVLDERQRAIRDGSVRVSDVNEEIGAAKELVERLEGPNGDEAERELLEWLRMEADGRSEDGTADAEG